MPHATGLEAGLLMASLTYPNDCHNFFRSRIVRSKSKGKLGTLFYLKTAIIKESNSILL